MGRMEEACMNQEHDIAAMVYAAKNDVRAADDLVRQYMPFIKAETARFLHRFPEEGQDDELSIAMFAFHEAVLSYNRLKGAFLHYAAVGIRRRLIDHYRREKRHAGVLSLESGDDGREDSAGSLVNQVIAVKDEAEALMLRSATKTEIREFSVQLKEFGISLGDIAENCPRQRRTREVCRRVLHYARANPALLENFIVTKKLPVAQLAEGAGVERKTLERHRKYMVAVMLAYTNGYEIIRGHLNQVMPGKEERV